jgi:hypothetical protein
VNDADRLRHDPAMRWIVGGKAAQSSAASLSQMGRFETQWLAAPKNLAALADLSGQWIDLVHGRRPPRGIVLDTAITPDPLRRLPAGTVFTPINYMFGGDKRDWVFWALMLRRSRRNAGSFRLQSRRLRARFANSRRQRSMTRRRSSNWCCAIGGFCACPRV